MDLELKGRVVVVTGGANGIGAAIVRACGREGAIPVIFDRDEPAAGKLKRELLEQGIETDAVLLDLGDASSCTRAVDGVAEKFGRLDGLVNNAGVNDGVGLQHGSPEGFAASLRFNFGHYYTMTQAAGRYLAKTKGAVVNISSKVAITGQGGTSGYAAAKGAILGATSVWAVELAGQGVRVNALIPAEVRTPQYEVWLKKFDNPEEKLRGITSKIPVEQRMTEPQEIAAMAVFLLSRRSGGVTGQQLFVDGGYVHLDRKLP
jgi:L-fucose dehydrogenase